MKNHINKKCSKIMKTVFLFQNASIPEQDRKILSYLEKYFHTLSTLQMADQNKYLYLLELELEPNR